jgi:hypothetical protein
MSFLGFVALHTFGKTNGEKCGPDFSPMQEFSFTSGCQRNVPEPELEGRNFGEPHLLTASFHRADLID